MLQLGAKFSLSLVAKYIMFKLDSSIAVVYCPPSKWQKRKPNNCIGDKVSLSEWERRNPAKCKKQHN